MIKKEFSKMHDLIAELCNLTSSEENNTLEYDLILNIDNNMRLQIINKLNKNLNCAISNSIQIEIKTNLINENEILINLLVQCPTRPLVNQILPIDELRI